VALTDLPSAKVRCPKCQSRLDVAETASGAKTISVSFLGPSVEESARALERFQMPGADSFLACPACDMRFDPAEPNRTIPPLNRR
jgi:uncharacterized protein YbaR (Trm112 family)